MLAFFWLELVNFVPLGAITALELTALSMLGIYTYDNAVS